MTVREWLDARTPAPPAALAAQVRAAFGPALDAEASTVSEAALAAAERLLASLLARGCLSRDQAGALLTADALVTYALEAAADDPAHVAERADDVMRRIAALVPDAA